MLNYLLWLNGVCGVGVVYLIYYYNMTLAKKKKFVLVNSGFSCLQIFTAVALFFARARARAHILLLLKLAKCVSKERKPGLSSLQ